MRDSFNYFDGDDGRRRWRQRTIIRSFINEAMRSKPVANSISIRTLFSRFGVRIRSTARVSGGMTHKRAQVTYVSWAHTAAVSEWMRNKRRRKRRRMRRGTWDGLFGMINILRSLLCAVWIDADAMLFTRQSSIFRKKYFKFLILHTMRSLPHSLASPEHRQRPKCNLVFFAVRCVRQCHATECRENSFESQSQFSAVGASTSIEIQNEKIHISMASFNSVHRTHVVLDEATWIWNPKQAHGATRKHTHWMGGPPPRQRRVHIQRYPSNSTQSQHTWFHFEYTNECERDGADVVIAFATVFVIL